MTHIYHKNFSLAPADAEILHSIHFESLAPNSLLCDVHWHNRFELILVTSGMFRFRLNFQELVVEEGQIAIIPPKALHYGLVGENGCTCIAISFDMQILCEHCVATKAYADNLLEQKISFTPKTDNPEIVAVFNDIYKGFGARDTISQLIQVGNVYTLLSLLHKHCLSSEPANNVIPENFKEVLLYINQNFTQKISIEELSQHFGYNFTYFCRQFKHIVGLSPVTYIKNLRLEKAAEIMHRELVSIEEVATRCGFDDASYFARCFKEAYNISPLKYIQLFKE